MKNVLLLSRNRLSLSARIAHTNSNSHRMLAISLSNDCTLVYSCCRQEDNFLFFHLHLLLVLLFLNLGLFWFCYPDSISLVESDEEPMQR